MVTPSHAEVATTPCACEDNVAAPLFCDGCRQPAFVAVCAAAGSLDRGPPSLDDFDFCLRLAFLAADLLVAVGWTTGTSFTGLKGGGPTSSPRAMAASVIGPGCHPLFCCPILACLRSCSPPRTNAAGP